MTWDRRGNPEPVRLLPHPVERQPHDGVGRSAAPQPRHGELTPHSRSFAAQWNNIKPGTLTKMYTNQPDKFDSVYSRDRL